MGRHEKVRGSDAHTAALGRQLWRRYHYGVFARAKAAVFRRKVRLFVDSKAGRCSSRAIARPVRDYGPIVGRVADFAPTAFADFDPNLLFIRFCSSSESVNHDAVFAWRGSCARRGTD